MKNPCQDVAPDRDIPLPNKEAKYQSGAVKPGVIGAHPAEVCEANEIARRWNPLRKDLNLADEKLMEQQSPCGLFQDIPRSIWTIFLSGWAMFFLLMWLFFAVNPDSTFMVTVAMLFGLMAFGLPMVMAKQSKGAAAHRGDVIHTHTGPVSVRAAGVQIALIPIAIVVGILGFILFAKQ